jgi:hypothetical protein
MAGQVLLDGRLGGLGAELLDVGGDIVTKKSPVTSKRATGSVTMPTNRNV